MAGALSARSAGRTSGRARARSTGRSGRGPGAGPNRRRGRDGRSRDRRPTWRIDLVGPVRLQPQQRAQVALQPEQAAGLGIGRGLAGLLRPCGRTGPVPRRARWRRPSSARCRPRPGRPGARPGQRLLRDHVGQDHVGGGIAQQRARGGQGGDVGREGVAGLGLVQLRACASRSPRRAVVHAPHPEIVLQVADAGGARLDADARAASTPRRCSGPAPWAPGSPGRRSRWCAGKLRPRPASRAKVLEVLRDSMSIWPAARRRSGPGRRWR